MQICPPSSPTVLQFEGKAYACATDDFRVMAVLNLGKNYTVAVSMQHSYREIRVLSKLIHGTHSKCTS
jgi:hypothetical protein